MAPGPDRREWLRHEGPDRRHRDLYASCQRTPMSDPGAAPISVILPVLNEQDNLEPLHDRLTEALDPMGRDYEVIYVDDGSTDESWEALKKIAVGDRRVRLVRLRRNFGQTAALAAGFAHSRYPIVVTLDADHEDRKSTRLNSSHMSISYAVFCLNKKINSGFAYTSLCVTIRMLNIT